MRPDKARVGAVQIQVQNNCHDKDNIKRLIFSVGHYCSEFVEKSSVKKVENKDEAVENSEIGDLNLVTSRCAAVVSGEVFEAFLEQLLSGRVSETSDKEADVESRGHQSYREEREREVESSYVAVGENTEERGDKVVVGLAGTAWERIAYTVGDVADRVDAVGFKTGLAAVADEVGAEGVDGLAVAAAHKKVDTVIVVVVVFAEAEWVLAGVGVGEGLGAGLLDHFD